jgi:UDP-N-acetylglucosamine:LPS N-acetylglucosamine transferase
MVARGKKLRICLAASGGGHLTELLTLSECWKPYEVFYITTVPVIQRDLRKSGNVYVVGECNRQHPIRVLKVFLRCLRVVLKERPCVVISSGAAAGCMVCFLARALRAKIIWIDSITNVERISLSGRMVRWIADLFLVQWPDLASRYKRVEFVGTVV